MAFRLKGAMLAGAAILYGALVLGNGSDRLSAVSPGIERLVPGPFRSSAAVAAGSYAVAEKDFAAAERHAARGIAASPLNREAIGLLAVSRLMQDKADAADAAFRVSGQLGWRDLPTQLYWYQVGLDSGDDTLVAQRADAVLRTNPDYAEALRLLQPLESTPARRDALIGRLVERPDWLDRYPHPGKDVGDAQLRDRALVLTGLAARHVRLGCDAIADMAGQLVDRGMRDESLALWKAQCGRSQSASGLFDPDFQGLAANRPSPFAWRVYASGDVDVRAANTADGTLATAIANASSFPLPVLRQSVVLAPGSWRVKIAVVDPAAARGKMFVSVGCGADDGRHGNTMGDPAGAGQVITVPDCPRQGFAIWMAPQSDSVTLRRITLERTGS